MNPKILEAEKLIELGELKNAKRQLWLALKEDPNDSELQRIATAANVIEALRHIHLAFKNERKKTLAYLEILKRDIELKTSSDLKKRFG